MPDIGDYFMETSGKWTLACLLLQFKHYGNCEFTTDRFASLLTGFPFGHGGNHTDSFFIQVGIYASYYFYIYDAAVFVDNEFVLLRAPWVSGFSCA